MQESFKRRVTASMSMRKMEKRARVHAVAMAYRGRRALRISFVRGRSCTLPPLCPEHAWLPEVSRNYRDPPAALFAAAPFFGGVLAPDESCSDMGRWTNTR